MQQDDFTGNFCGPIDLVDITLQGTEPSAAFGISEDYRFTVEAFREYQKHLTGNWR